MSVLSLLCLAAGEHFAVFPLENVEVAGEEPIASCCYWEPGVPLGVCLLDT